MRIWTGLLLAAATLLAPAAADNKVIGPFALRITGKENADVDGFAWACHAGAATEALCYSPGSAPVSGPEFEFYYNYSYYGDDTYPGYLSYVLSYQGDGGDAVHVPSFMRIVPNYASNIHVALIPPGPEGGAPLSLDYKSGYFYMGSLYDDSHWNVTAPFGQPGVNVSNFHLCYQWTGGYWYHSVGWMSGLERATPQNPSCQPINLGVQSLKGTEEVVLG